MLGEGGLREWGKEGGTSQANSTKFHEGGGI